MKDYCHLSLIDRERLWQLREQGLTFRQIGDILHRNHTTISREYRNNTKYGKKYLPYSANQKAIKESIKQRAKAPLKNPCVFLYVRQKIRAEGWSPETIAGRLPLDIPGESIHHETIYRYIYNPKKTREDKLWKYLVHHRKRRLRKNGRKVKRSSKIKNAVSIELRSKRVDPRTRIGDWETDNMEGVKKDKSVLTATVDRACRKTLINKLKDRKSITKIKSVGKRLNRLPKKALKTITADNGAENAKHEQLTKQVNIPVYFCHPYSSWEKGTVENTIGRIRRYLPKGTSLDKIPVSQIGIIEEKMNNTPRKCLGFLTPNEKFNQLLGKRIL
ncbi:IS30 family transposase [Patescibacteria group bacterium]|nr:IS30 family transposase [Patescibacteria group bacterium]